MKTYKKVLLKTNGLQDKKVLETLEKFAKSSTRWKFLKKESRAYSEGISDSAAQITLDDGAIYPSVCVAKQKENIFYVANIIPKALGDISISQYNRFAKDFASDLSKFIKENRSKIKLSISSDNKHIEEIITSKVALKIFNRFMNAYPTSYHPNDVQRLDKFIIVASIYCRKEINLELLEKYFIEDVGWSNDNARWCCNRIETGLQILKLKKKYHP